MHLKAMSTHSRSSPIRIVIVDDNYVVRAGLKALLAGVADIQVLGEAANGRDALTLIERVSPDVAVLDLDMPIMDGCAVLQTLVAAQSPTRVLVLSVHDDVAQVASLLGAGADGYLKKSAADRQLIDAVRAVAPDESNERALPSRIAADRSAGSSKRRVERMQYEALSDREREVLVLVAEGHSASEIGERLCISPKNVESYKERVSRTLGLHRRRDFVRYCLRLDLLHAHP